MKKCCCLMVAVLGFCAAPVLGDLWPHKDGMMEHVFIGFDGTNIAVTLENPDNLPLPMLAYPGEHYTAPANVLDDKGYSSQFGWQITGAWAPPAGTSVWVQRLGQTSGLETYEGGMRTMIPMHTFAPLFGTANSSLIWRWPGTMVHNWYAASAFGDYQATYDVYLGDAVGVRNTAYGSDTVTLSWRYAPEPATLVLLGFTSLLMLRRR
jgi:hypothetical protein